MKLFNRVSHFNNVVEQVPLFSGSSPVSMESPTRISSYERQLPSFFIIGPPRTGTSWLHQVLATRASLPSPSKETRFFDTHFQRGFEWYQAAFPKRHNLQLRGEVAPTYFASASARQRIAEYIPSARVVCAFRNPVERIISLYRLKRAYGMIPWNFEQALSRDPELLESSKYASNLKAWQSELGEDHVLPTIYDDLRHHPQSYLDTLVDFIGIPRFILSPNQIQFVHSSEFLTHPRDFQRTRHANMMAEWCKARQLGSLVSAVKKTPLVKLFLGGGPAFAAMSQELTQKLYQRFLPEVEDLEAMLNRDLSHWKSASQAA